MGGDTKTEDPALANPVVLRYFGELTRKDVAEVLAVSPTTVVRHSRTARARLFADLAKGSTDAL